MTIAPIALCPVTQLPITTPATLYTAGVNGVTLVKRASFTNTDSVTRTFSVYKVPNGGAVSSATAIVFNASLSAGQTISPPELINLVLSAQDTLRAVADAANKVNATVSGLIV